MFGLGKKKPESVAKSVVPKIAPCKPDIPKLRTWNIAWGFGQERSVQAHCVKVTDGEAVFMVVDEHERTNTAWFSDTPSYTWLPRWRDVMRVNSYIYIEEVEDVEVD